MSVAPELVATLLYLRVGVEDLLHRADQQDKAGASPIMGREGDGSRPRGATARKH